VPSFSSEVKGFREATAALNRLKRNKASDPVVMLVGNRTPATDSIQLDKYNIGYISDNARLSLAYSAADVVIVPSLEETFSNTTAESIACGTPVVGFKTGAIPEMVIDEITGYTFQPGDAEGLADGIARVLAGPDLSGNCRQYALQNLQFDIQARRYEELFIDLHVRNRRAGDWKPTHSDASADALTTLLQLAERKFAATTAVTSK
jgi:glycosyltransferase involved in cell wall biosynthesis